MKCVADWEKLKMDQAFIEKMKKELLKQRKTILESLAGQSDDMRELVKTNTDAALNAVKIFQRAASKLYLGH